MKAAVYASKGPARDVLRVVERPLPVPQAGEVRVRLAFSGVNPSDVKTRSRPGMDYPEVVPHSDGAGRIDAIGPQVPEELLNRRVWLYNGQWDRADGTAAQYIALPAAQAVALPDDVPFEVGASVGIPLMTAFHAVQACDSLIGRTVLVPGAAGSVGFYAAQLARLAGATVIAVVSSDAKAAIARRAGAESVIDYRTEDVVQRVRDLTDGRGVDRIIEVDASRYARHYGELLRFGGKAVIYGSNEREVPLSFRPLIMGFATLYFFIVYRLPADVLRQTTTAITMLLARGDLQHPEAAVHPLDDIVVAHERVEQGANAKVLVELPD